MIIDCQPPIWRCNHGGSTFKNYNNPKLPGGLPDMFWRIAAYWPKYPGKLANMRRNNRYTLKLFRVTGRST
ncbi:hypothetical protein AA11825_0003 [Acetobacter pomorum DSM 11825]|nr:hypothetical protein AA11825_0003 [Acetobacter pomorum DSM 11825]